MNELGIPMGVPINGQLGYYRRHSVNLFIFDHDPAISAAWLDDLRKNKLVLETAQLLSAAVRVNSERPRDDVYRLTHRNHPCAIWTRTSRGNFRWVFNYFNALVWQRGVDHKSYRLHPVFYEFLVGGDFPSEDRTPFPNCARNSSLGLNYTEIQPTTEAYRAYYKKRVELSKVPLTWRNGTKPEWL